MNHKIISVLIFGALLLHSCSDNAGIKGKNKFSNPEIQNIYDLCDHRDSEGLMPFLQSPDSSLRAAAALAFSSIQDASKLTALEALLTDKDEMVRSNAAYAIGQTGEASSLNALAAFYTIEQSELVRAQMLESVGKLTGIASQKNIDGPWADEGIHFLDTIRFDTEGDRIGWAKAAFWIHASGMVDNRLMNRMPFVLQKTGGDSRVMCALAMTRFKDDSWFKEEKNKKFVLQWCQSERNPDVRVAQMSMLAKINDADAKKVLLGYVNSDSQDQSVLVAALRAAAKMNAITAEEILPLMSNGDEYVVLECLNALEKKSITKVINAIAEKCATRSAHIYASALRLINMQSPADNGESIWRSFEKATDTYDKVHFAHALGVVPAYATQCYDAIKQTGELPLKYALTEAFMEMQQQKSWPKDRVFASDLFILFDTGDIGVQALVAQAFSQLKMSDDEKKNVVEKLNGRLPSLSLPKEIETYNEIVKCVNVLTGEKTEEKKVAFNHPIDWKLVAEIKSDQKAKVTTSKGVFVIDLNVNDAPGSVASFVQLVKDGFYNDKYFHRVIPNFVIQGGCPRGDGMGSTDYTIRSEFALHDYRPGAVGLASSGKDTESCQWFVSHTYTPHLEGRYTIFGYVNSGLDVVKKIMVGDKILKVEIL